MVVIKYTPWELPGSTGPSAFAEVSERINKAYNYHKWEYYEF